MRGRTRTVVKVLAVLPLVVLAACSSTSSDDGSDRSAPTTASDGGAADLTANPWQLESWATTKGVDSVLQFAKDGSWSGTTGCNSFAGSYTVDGDRLTMTLGPMTKRACTDPALTAQETALTDGLGQVTSYSVDDGTLLLKVGETVRFTYRAEDASLEGEWKVTGLNNGVGGLESSAATEELVMVITEDSVTVAGGCNTLSANVVTTGEESLTFGPVSSTKKACEGDAAKVDQQMADALGRTTDYEVVGGKLTLRDKDGAMQVTAQRADG